MNREGQSLCLLQCDGGRGRCEQENIFHKLDMTEHKYLFEGRVKTDKDTLSKE